VHCLRPGHRGLPPKRANEARQRTNSSLVLRSLSPSDLFQFQLLLCLWSTSPTLRLELVDPLVVSRQKDSRDERTQRRQRKSVWRGKRVQEEQRSCDCPLALSRIGSNRHTLVVLCTFPASCLCLQLVRSERDSGDLTGCWSILIMRCCRDVPLREPGWIPSLFLIVFAVIFRLFGMVVDVAEMSPAEGRSSAAKIKIIQI